MRDAGSRAWYVWRQMRYAWTYVMSEGKWDVRGHTWWVKADEMCKMRYGVVVFNAWYVWCGWLMRDTFGVPEHSWCVKTDEGRWRQMRCTWTCAMQVVVVKAWYVWCVMREGRWDVPVDTRDARVLLNAILDPRALSIVLHMVEEMSDTLRNPSAP